MNEYRMDSLDPLDLKLISELERDARQAHNVLARKLGVSRPTIISRIKKFTDARLMRFVCLVDHVALGYTVEVIIAINTQPDKLINVADRLQLCEPIHHIMLCTGRFDIIAAAMLKDREQLFQFLSQDLRTIPGIIQLETLLVLRHVKVSTTLLAEDTRFYLAESPATDLEAIDLTLIKQLQADANQTSGQLAITLGTSESTVRRKIHRLLEKKIIRIQAVVDPFAVGFDSIASVWMKVDPRKINDAAEAVASHANVKTVDICTGRYDIIAWAMFRGLNDLNDFITQELSSVPGLSYTETMPHLKIWKASYRFSTD